MRASSRHRLLHASLALLILTFGCGGSPAESPTSPSLLEPAAANTASARAGSPMGVPNDRYDGVVDSVDLAASTFTLAGGTVVETTASTRWKRGGNRITSLAGLADAVAAGREVVARGRGTDNGSTIVAEDVDARLQERPVDQERFRDLVASSDGTTMVLADGTEVAADAATRWKSGPARLTSMEQVADAVDSGLDVRARGRGTLQADGSVLATELDVRSLQATSRPFRGAAADADPAEGALTLADETVVVVTAATSWKSGPRRIGSLEDLETALLVGAEVWVRGRGVRRADGSITASELDVRFRARALERFRGAAESVDPEAGTLTLADGTVVTVFDATRWKTGGRWLSSLEEILVALDAGEPVRVFGRGTREDASSILAARIRAKVRPGR